MIIRQNERNYRHKDNAQLSMNTKWHFDWWTEITWDWLSRALSSSLRVSKCVRLFLISTSEKKRVQKIYGFKIN